MGSLSQSIHKLEDRLKERRIDTAKLSLIIFVLAVLGAIWFSMSSTQKIIHGYNLLSSARKGPDINKKDIELFRGLLDMPVSRISPLDENVKKIKSLVNFPYGVIKIEELKVEDKEKENIQMGLDRVGTFRKFKIIFSGGVLEQIEFLKTLNEFSNFMLVEKIVGDSNGIQIIFSIYGTYF